MGAAAALPLVAAAVLLALGWFAQTSTEAHRIDAVAQAVTAAGYGAGAEVEAIPGDECWRAREGFRWRTAKNEGWACAGPRDEVSIKSAKPRQS